MKRFEIYLRLSNTTRVCKFKKDTVDEARSLVKEFEDKYCATPTEDGSKVEVFYKIVEKTVIEERGEI